MTGDQQAHISGISQRVTRDLHRKYTLGQREHGGNLWECAGLFKEVRDELLDLITYQDTLEHQLREVLDRLGDVIRMTPDRDTSMALLKVFEKLDACLGHGAPHQEHAR